MSEGYITAEGVGELPAWRQVKVLQKKLDAMTAALQQIENYSPTWHELSAEEVADMEACEDCAVAQDRKWPPSLTCDRHFVVLSHLKDRNDHERGYQHHHMRAIAQEALRTLKGAADYCQA